MSGRWIETDAVWSSLTLLDAALLDTKGSSWVHRPQELTELENINNELDHLETMLSNWIDKLNSSGVISPNQLEAILEASDEEIAALGTASAAKSKETEASSLAFDHLLVQLDSTVQRQQDLLQRIQNNLPTSLSITTNDGPKSLDYTHGRYRYKHWVDEFEGMGENLNWLNEITVSYQRNEKSITTTKIKSTATDKYARAKALITSRRKQAESAALRVSVESLRRARDKEIMAVGKSQGYKITRKVNKKKVQYVLVRYR